MHDLDGKATEIFWNYWDAFNWLFKGKKVFVFKCLICFHFLFFSAMIDFLCTFKCPLFVAINMWMPSCLLGGGYIVL